MEIGSDKAKSYSYSLITQKKKLRVQKTEATNHMNFRSDHSVKHYQTFVRTLIDCTVVYVLFPYSKKDRHKKTQHIIKETSALKAYIFFFHTYVREQSNSNVQSYI